MLLLLALACTLTGANPCQQYADYICDCHGDDPDYDCASVQDQYSTSDPDLEDECEASLSDLKREDEAAGRECSSGSDTGDTAA